MREALHLPPAVKPGFALLASAPELFGRDTARLECHVRFRDGSTTPAVTRDIKLIAHDHRLNHDGVLAEPAETRLCHRADIYPSGPSVSATNPDCLGLIRRYLGSLPVRVLDVGCGFGSYGRALLADGYDWFGVEVKASDCDELARLGLPHRRVDRRTLHSPTTSSMRQSASKCSNPSRSRVRFSRNSIGSSAATPCSRCRISN